MHTPEMEGRTCGPCTACCTTHAIFELRKPERTPCAFIYEGGCGRYETRPHSCRHYRCAWRMGWGAQGERPDLSGRVLDIHVGDTVRLSIVCLDGSACSDTEARALLARLMAEYELSVAELVVTDASGEQRFLTLVA